MPSFSGYSLKKLGTCEKVLQTLMLEVIKKTDFSVICGERTEEDQDKAFNSGNSKVRFPHSKHNKHPSHAVDIAPWPIRWDHIEDFIRLAEVVKETWLELTDEQRDGWKLEWGGEWKTFRDYPHFQIVKE